MSTFTTKIKITDVDTDIFSFDDIFLFRALSFDEKELIKESLREEIYQRGDFVFTEGEDCQRVMIVCSGNVKVFRTTVTGKEQILEILGPGETCLCNPAASQWCCNSSAQALDSTRIWFIPKEVLARLSKKNVDLSHTFSRLLADRLCRYSSLIEEITLNDPVKRLINFILSSNQSKKGCGESCQCLSFTLTHEEIAQRIGVTRETVSRQLQKLKKQKLIESTARRITILNREKLTKMLRS